MKHTKRLIILLLLLLIAGIGASAYLLFKEKEYPMKDFTGKSQKDVETWVSENQIPSDLVIYTYVYNDEIAKGNVISQSVRAGSGISKNNLVTIRISEGTDPDRKVTIPDFSGKSLDEIKKWFTDNGFANVTYNTEIHDDLKEDTFVSVNPSAGTAVHINDPVTVITSVKSSDSSGSVTVPDFTGYTYDQIIAWAEENSIYIQVLHEDSDTVASGTFIHADVPAGTSVDPGSTITVTLAD